MQQTERDEFKQIISSVKEMYGIDNLVEEALAWYDMQKHMPLDNSLGMIELVKQTPMFPAVRKAILFALTLPATPCTVLRSFSTLRRVMLDLVKINDEWYTSVRSLYAKCPLRQGEQPEDRANEQVIDNLGRDRQRLQFLS